MCRTTFQLDHPYLPTTLDVHLLEDAMLAILHSFFVLVAGDFRRYHPNDLDESPEYVSKQMATEVVCNALLPCHLDSNLVVVESE